MVRHLVMWNFKEDLSSEEKALSAQRIKQELEALADTVPGAISVKVITDLLSSSNREIVLNSLFESEEALEGYQVHPEHLKAAGFVRTVTADRICMDFEEE